MKKIFLLLALCFIAFTTVMAQTPDTAKAVKDTVSQTATTKTNPSVFVQMDDTLRSSGKIYVVIATIAIVFVGLAIFLFAIDRRLKKLEK